MGSTASTLNDAHFLVVPAGGTGAAERKRRLWARLSPLQRALLATDGSFTLLLSALTGEGIKADLVRQERVISSELHARLDVTVHDEVIERVVSLYTATTRRTVAYATSVILPGRLPQTISRRLAESDDPIGLVLRWQRLETFRELNDWGSTDRADILTRIDARSALYRTYTIYAMGMPCMAITEYFVDDDHVNHQESE